VCFEISRGHFGANATSYFANGNKSVAIAMHPIYMALSGWLMVLVLKGNLRLQQELELA